MARTERWIVWAAAALLVAAGAAFGACGGSSSTSTTAGDGGGAPCQPCVTDTDCAGEVCVQLGVDSVCAPACDPSSAACASDRTCTPTTNVAGQQVSVCAPNGDVCGPPVTDDAGAASGDCPGLAPPTAQSTCTSCTGKSTCQTNGCYGGWWCNLATNRCQAPPSSCGTNGGVFDGGAPVTGTVDATGGKLSRVYFAVVGDTRPPTPDDTAGYPTAIITKIYDAIQGLSPRPAFVVSTGDYQFSSTGSAQAGAQLDLYLGARGKYAGPVFPAMGNHECTGATASNCGTGNPDGVTSQMTAYTQKLLAPIQQQQPYYAIRVDALDGSWTSKTVFIAANAWTADQATWLDQALADPTTYTFVVRHESKYANQAPGVTPSEQIMAKHPYTLSIVGHTHTYEHWSNSREVIVGNGGAPLTGNKNYGYAVVQQRPDGAIQVDMLDYATGNADPSFRFAVKADGTATP